MLRNDARDVPGLARVLAAAHGGSVGHVYEAALKGFSITLGSDAAAEAIARNPNVAYVEPDQEMTASIIQSGATWGLDRIDQRLLPLSTTFTYTATASNVTPVGPCHWRASLHSCSRSGIASDIRTPLPQSSRAVGCLTRIGCAAVLVAGGALGYWLYGDRLPSVLSRAASGAADKVTDAAVRTSERFDSEEGARIAAEQEARRRAAREQRDRELGWVTVNVDGPVAPKTNPLASFTRRRGPAYVSLDAGQVAGLLAPLFAQLPPSAATAQLALDDDLLLVRTSVSLSDFTGQSAVGAVLGKALVGEDTLFLAGRLEPVRPGLAQFRVREVRLKGIDVPTRLIPGLVRSLRRAAMDTLPETKREAEREARTKVDSGTGRGRGDLADDALPVPLPNSASDVRVVNSKLTIYRAASSSGPAAKP